MPKSLTLLFSADKNRQTLIIEHAIRKGFDHSLPVTWQNILDGDSAKKEPVKILPNTGSHDIPMSNQKPLDLVLNLGSKASFTADQNALHVTLVVTDNQIQPAKTDDLWNGDAVEIFIDPHPFENQDCLEVSQGSEALDVWQYIFAAKPSDTQTRQLIKNPSHKQPVVSKAEHTVSLGKGQYTLKVSIPWSEILSQGNLGQVIGLEIEIDHANDDKVIKESLGNKPGRSFRERLHYPLFHIPDAVIRKYRSLLQQVNTQNQAATAGLRIDISSQGNRIPLTFNKGSEDIRGIEASWLKENSNKRLLILGPLANKWQRRSFTFTPQSTGKLTLDIMGNPNKQSTQWCYSDDFKVQGLAGFKNGSFEKRDPKGRPIGWTTLNKPMLIHDIAGAAQGDCYIMTDDSNRFRQVLLVQKGQPVTVSFQAKAGGTQRVFQMKR